ncbi:DUF6282 family protein [Brucella gallinifaecis]|uniref:DUF6282 family protein n=1 Tax=Brucella gallinifaecis TaxID=215590 RepID=UPI002361BC44|nr:DUF6282 family protein [Brucella gallinifaecis]
MAETTTNYPMIVPIEPMVPERAAKVADLLQGAVDLHCHSGPAAMPRILGHHQAFQEAEEAGFKALLYKDHYYVGMPHCATLREVYPEMKTKLFSGVALNNATGGINPYAVDHSNKIGGKIVWFPTFSARNHIEAYASKAFPKTARPMLAPTPLSVLDANGQLIDNAKKICDLIAEDDVILSSGHLSVAELVVLFEEARSRGVKKLMINHPSYLIGCSDQDIRDFVAMGVYMEHSICMFIAGRAQMHDPADLKHLIDVAGVEHTILGSDLGLTQAPKPVDGFRSITSLLIDLGYSDDQIRKMTSKNAAGLLGLDA